MALVQPRQPKEDDITAVLGRFKAWNTGLDAHRAPESEVFTGLEEISYEEALGDMRRLLPRPISTPPVDLAAALDVAKDTVSFSSKSQQKATQARTDGAYESLPQKVESTGAVSAAASALTASSSSARRDLEQNAEAFVGQQAALPVQKKANVRSTSGVAKKANGAMLAPPSRSAGVKRASPSKAPPASKNGRNTLNAQLATSSRAQPTFKAMLEDRLAADRKQANGRTSAKVPAGTRAKSSMVPWVQARSVSLKLKVSAGEHETIKAGASEAGLPLAAYMRQCTLDVEVLRKLLKQTIADIRAFETTASQQLLAAPVRDMTPVKPARPGLFKRLKDAWLDKSPQAGT